MTQNELAKTIKQQCTWLEQSTTEDLKRIEQGISPDEITVGMAHARAETMTSLSALLDKWLQMPT